MRTNPALQRLPTGAWWRKTYSKFEPYCRATVESWATQCQITRVLELAAADKAKETICSRRLVACYKQGRSGNDCTGKKKHMAAKNRILKPDCIASRPRARWYAPYQQHTHKGYGGGTKHRRKPPEPYQASIKRRTKRNDDGLIKKHTILQIN